MIGGSRFSQSRGHTPQRARNTTWASRLTSSRPEKAAASFSLIVGQSPSPANSSSAFRKTSNVSRLLATEAFGNGITAACGMARKFGQSPVKNGRDSWTLTPAALSPTIERLPSYYVDGNVKVTLGGLNMRRCVAMVELSPYFGVQTPVWRE